MTEDRKSKKMREAKPGELRAISMVESLEKMSRRPETRLDAERILESLSPDGKIYARHLIMSGPTGNGTTAKALGLTLEQLETVMSELEIKLENHRSGK